MASDNVGTHAVKAPSKKNRKSLIALLITAVIIVVIVIGATILFRRSTYDIKRNQYQAVFLTNNQTYFGKITRITKDIIQITDVYYIQPNQNAQNNQITLIKLGDEVHAPENTMIINRQQVLFWENIKDDGKVVQLIKQNQQK